MHISLPSLRLAERRGGCRADAGSTHGAGAALRPARGDAARLGRALTNITIISTASRPVTKAWCANLGAEAFQAKCDSLHPEDVFMRSRLQTLDLAEQGEILRQVGELVDAGKIRSTLTSTIGAINAATLAQAHRLIESGTAVGKVALEGFTSQP